MSASALDSSLVLQFVEKTKNTLEEEGSEEGHEYTEDEEEESFKKIFSVVESDSSQLMRLVVLLEPHLTTSQQQQRYRGVLLLALLLERAESNLSASQLHHLSIFFLSRLQDEPSLAPCLRALKGVVTRQWKNLEEEYLDISDMFQCLFTRLEVQEHPQSIRARVFDLLDALLSCPLVPKWMKAESEKSSIVDGVLNSIEGEKDPRCLVQSFRLVSRLYTAIPVSTFLGESKRISPSSEALLQEYGEFDKGSSESAEDESPITQAERIFNIMACYFPITFKPPPGDPYGITSPMLIQALAHALCDNEHVAAFTGPFLVDQLLAPPETVCRSHALYYLSYMVLRHSRIGGDVKENSCSSSLPGPISESLGQLSEVLYDIALEDTSSLPTLDINKNQMDNDMPRELLESCDNLNKQALFLVKLICRQIGNSRQGDDLWVRFGDPIVSHIRKMLQKSVQGLNSKATLSVALTMGLSTYKIAMTVFLSMFPCLLQHVQPHLEDELQHDDVFETLLQHDKERKIHERESAASGLFYISELLGTLKSFELNFSQVEEVHARSLNNFINMFDLIDRYVLKSFSFETVSRRQKFDVRIYSSCLKCMQMPLKVFPNLYIRQFYGSRLLREITLNCMYNGAKSTHVEPAHYDRVEQIQTSELRKVSVEFICQIKTICLQQHDETDASPTSFFMKECVDELECALEKDESCRDKQYAFQTMANLLLPSDDELSSGKAWNTVDDRLLYILIDYVGCNRPYLRSSALSALVETLSFHSDGHCDEGKEKWYSQIALNILTGGSSDGSTPLQRLLAIAARESSDEATVHLVSKLLHRVLSFYQSSVGRQSAASSDNISLEKAAGVVKEALNGCVRSFLTTVSAFPVKSVISKGSIPSTEPHSFSRVNTVKLLSTFLSALDPSCSIWIYINDSSAGDDSKSSHLFARMIDAVLSLSMGESLNNSHSDYSDGFALECANVLAIIVNKASGGANLDLLLEEIRGTVLSNLSSLQWSEVVREGTIYSLILCTRAVCMRRILKKEKSDADPSRSWQDSLLGLVIQCSLEFRESSDELSTTSLLMLGKYIRFISCEFKENSFDLSSNSSTGILWRQKIWNKLFLEFSTPADEAMSHDKASFITRDIAVLLCLCNVAAEMPFSVVRDHMPLLIDYSVKALAIVHQHPLKDSAGSSSDLLRFGRRQLLFSSSQCILAACQTTDDEVLSCLKKHLSTVIPLLVQTAQAPPDEAIASTRASCVKCLHFIAGGDMHERFPYHVLHPLKRAIVRGLGKALEDKKRSVRRWAAKVRNEWIALNE